MNAPERLPLPDIQSLPDTRNVDITRVGVKDVRHPMPVAAAGGLVQHTVASLDMYVALPAHAKGTHMSRFLEVLHAHDTPLDVGSLRSLHARMLERLDADAGYLEFRFPYFVTKIAPVSGAASPLDYDVRMVAEGVAGDGCRITLAVSAPVTSLCPCSREISEYGAHNQRSRIDVTVRLAEAMTPEALIRLAEDAASCEIWGLLKRADEKYVTERAYENPKFVEDLVRDIAVRLEDDARVLGYVVASENFESIHNHSAYALVERDKAPAGGLARG